MATVISQNLREIAILLLRMGAPRATIVECVCAIPRIWQNLFYPSGGSTHVNEPTLYTCSQFADQLQLHSRFAVKLVHAIFHCLKNVYTRMIFFCLYANFNLKSGN